MTETTKYRYERVNKDLKGGAEPIIEIPDNAHVVTIDSFGGSISAKCLIPVEDQEDPANPFLFDNDGQGNAP